MESMPKNAGFTLPEQIDGVQTLIEAARTRMTREGWEAKAILDLLGPAQAGLRTLKWLQANRDAVLAAAGAANGAVDG